MDKLDWNLARAFLATAEMGSLSAAARQLGLTQPTLSRQIAALEDDLGATLFERVGKRLEITDTGSSLLVHVRAMGEAAQAMTLAASGRSEQIAGRVTISATDGYATYLLPGLLQRIRTEAPQITLTILSSDSLSDLRRREADIAIRHVRPDDQGLIGKQIGESLGRFYASDEWRARNGHVRSPADLQPADLIGFEDTEPFVAHLRGLGVNTTVEGLRLISKSSVVVWEMARRGLGVSLMLDEIGRSTAGMAVLFPDLQPIRFPLWLVTHRELRTSRRIRLVFDILADELPRLLRRQTPATQSVPQDGLR